MRIQVQNDIIFRINNGFLRKFSACVKNAAPNEASGLIFGKVEQRKLDGDYQYHYNILHFECIESNRKSPVAFLLSDDVLLYQIASKVENQKGLRLIGVFHSHPSGTIPSSVDYHYMKTFYDAGIPKFRHLIWIIMDAQNNKFEVFMILNSVLTQIKVKVEQT